MTVRNKILPWAWAAIAGAVWLAAGCAAEVPTSPQTEADLEELAINPCAVTLCPTGTTCVVQGTPVHAECVPVDKCAAIRCIAGTHCEAGSCIPDAPKVFCGGIAAFPCPGSGKCVDDPSDSCDPKHGGADCGGMCICPRAGLCRVGSHWDPSPKVCGCVPDKKVFCGGIAGFPCPGAGKCADDPSDNCDPKHGGADCGGMCICPASGSCPIGSRWDSSPDVCACVPGATCGGNSCGAGQYCCNASCGICAPLGAACIQIACNATQ